MKKISILAFICIQLVTSNSWALPCPTVLSKIAAAASSAIESGRAALFPKKVSLADYRELKNKQNYTIENSADSFKALRNTPISFYFKKTSSEPKTELGFENVNSDEKAAFYDEAEAYLAKHSQFIGSLNRQKEFKNYWDRTKDQLLTKPFIEELKKNNVSLGALISALHVDFMGGGKPLMERIKDKVLHPDILKASISTAKTVKGFLMGLLVMGPGVQIFNSYLGSVINPIAQTAAQRGAMDLAPAAEWVQSMLSDHSKLNNEKKNLEEAKKARKEISGLVENLKTLSPEQVKERWQTFEDSFFTFYMRFNQTLPAHLRDGRNFIKDLAVNQLNSTAGWLATFDVQRQIYQDKVDALESLSHTRELTGEELAKKKEYQEFAGGAEDRIASVLAGWKLYEIMYPDFTQVPADVVEKQKLAGIYDVFNHSLRFDLYTKNFEKQMRAQLSKMDVVISQFEAGVKEAEAKK